MAYCRAEVRQPSLGQSSPKRGDIAIRRGWPPGLPLRVALRDRAIQTSNEFLPMGLHGASAFIPSTSAIDLAVSSLAKDRT